MTLAEQIQFVDALALEQERRAKMCRDGSGPNDVFGCIVQELAVKYQRNADGLREVAETLHRYQSLMT